MDAPTTLRFASFELDPHRRELRLGGRMVAVQPLVFDLLLHLVRRRDAVVGKEELIRDVWKGVVVGEGAITQALSQLRRTLRVGADPAALIRTVRGRGYRFIGDVRAAGTGAPVGLVNGAAGPSVAHSPDGACGWGVSPERAQAIIEAIRPEIERIAEVGTPGLWVCVVAVSTSGAAGSSLGSPS